MDVRLIHPFRHVAVLTRNDRKRYMHSTDSWRRLWTRVFTDLEGAEFTERHLLVDVEWEPLDVSVGTGRVQIDQMIWSVKIISGGKPAS